VKTNDPAAHYSQRILSENIMESGGKQMMRKGTGTVYRIVVHSELSRQYAVAFEETEMETKNGDTVLTGEVIDHNNSWAVNTIVCGVFIALILL
jgi:hypothetical protein